MPDDARLIDFVIGDRRFFEQTAEPELTFTKLLLVLRKQTCRSLQPVAQITGLTVVHRDRPLRQALAKRPHIVIQRADLTGNGSRQHQYRKSAEEQSDGCAFH